jgi:predicted PurR-regulated permease PerM
LTAPRRAVIIPARRAAGVGGTDGILVPAIAALLAGGAGLASDRIAPMTAHPRSAPAAGTPPGTPGRAGRLGIPPAPVAPTAGQRSCGATAWYRPPMDERPLPPGPSEQAPTVIYQYQPAPLTPLRIMALTLAVLFVLGLVWLTIQVRSIVLLFLFGILLAAAIEPLVGLLRRRGFSRGQSILAIYAVILALLGLAFYLVVPRLLEQGAELVENIPLYLTDFQQQAQRSTNDFIRTSGSRLIANISNFYDRLRENPLEAGAENRVSINPGQAVNVVTSVFGALFTTVSVMIVAFYWMTEKALIKRVVLSLFPIDKRDRAHDTWDQIEGKLGGWARGQLILMVVIGVLSTIAYSPLLLDVRFWFLLGIFAGLTELIPFVGPFLGGGLAAVVALTSDWQKAALVVLFVVVLQQVEGSVLVPRVMRNAVGLTPLTVFLALLVGGVLGGVVGAVLAIPVAAAVQVLVQDLLESREESADGNEIGASVAATLTGRTHPVPGGGVAGGAAVPYLAVDRPETSRPTDPAP